jgi:hypothetical protein
MTPYEYLDVATSYSELANSSLMGYFSVLCAYFIAAYAVGASMTRNQVTAVTGLFLVMQLFMTWGAGSFFYAARVYRGLAGEWTPTVGPHYIAIPLLVLGVISGLKFMWDIRHTKTE